MNLDQCTPEQNRSEFIGRLRKAGWKKKDAEHEYDRICGTAAPSVQIPRCRETRGGGGRQCSLPAGHKPKNRHVYECRAGFGEFMSQPEDDGEAFD